MTNTLFPHINRELTAGLLISVILLVSILNVLQNKLFKMDNEKKLRMAIMKNPQISSSHEKLGQYYLGKSMEAAKREYLLAQEYFIPPYTSQKTNVLGSQSPPARAGSPWQTWQEVADKIQNLDSDIKYWENVSHAYPDYLFADLKLALLSLRKGRNEKANNYLKDIVKNDPTDRNAINLLEKLR